MNWEERKHKYNELAARITSADPLDVLQILQSEADYRHETPRPEPAPQPSGPGPVSIWSPSQENGAWVFRRPKPLPLGDHFAAREVIPAKAPSGSKRLCFFGESVAAGYLYAPHLTPAAVLQHQLNQLEGHGAYDVVDLARTNETLDTLLLTVQQSLQLEPDLLVIFAGNNWNLLETPEASPYAPSPEARLSFAANAKRDGLVGAIDAAGHQLAHKASRALDHLAEIAGEIPVTLMVPEVNLLDWPSYQPVSWRPGDGVARWYDLYDQALAFLDSQEWHAALDAAMAMLAIDDGTCPTTFRLIARARLGSGATAKAIEACQAEVDSAYYAAICFLEAPRANSLARGLLHRKAQQHGFGVVDLREVFARAGFLPGNDLFADYCHLTAKGMHVAMGVVCTHLTGKRPWRLPTRRRPCLARRFMPRIAWLPHREDARNWPAGAARHWLATPRLSEPCSILSMPVRRPVQPCSLPLSNVIFNRHTA